MKTVSEGVKPAKFLKQHENMSPLGDNISDSLEVTVESQKNLQTLSKEVSETKEFDYSKENLSKLTPLELFNYGKFKKLFEKYSIPKGVARSNYNVRAYFVSDELVSKGKIVFPKGANPYLSDEEQNGKYSYIGSGVQNAIVKEWFIKNHNLISEDGTYLGK